MTNHIHDIEVHERSVRRAFVPFAIVIAFFLGAFLFMLLRPYF